ncbi:MAG TPA: hypothetical protein VGK42_10140 [Candidatus Dormibacteraeota bacterium]
MRLGVLVTRRFVSRANGREEVTELRRAVELGIPPVPGMILDFGDGSPDCTVSKIRHRVGTSGSFGVLPIEVELVGCKEPFAGLEAALEAGWQREEAPTAGARSPDAPLPALSL